MSKKENRIKQKLNILHKNIDSFSFTGLRITTTVFLFLFLLVIKYGYFIAPITSVLYYFLFEYLLLDVPISKVNTQLEEEALEFFPIFLLSLEGSRNIKKAIYSSTSIIESTLSLEFKKVLHDVKCGKSLDESLYLLQERVPSMVIKNIILSIREANRMGNSIDDSVNQQLNYLKEKKRKKELSYYQRVPLKLLVSSILFTLSILVVFLLFASHS